MLGKLIKHEWKKTYKIGCLMLFVTVLITFIGWMAFQSPMWHNFDNYRYDFNLLDFISVVTLIMYVLMLMGVVYGTMIYLGVHFYRSMYTDQGYLIHTLPVTGHQILVSKILVSSLWMLFVGIAIFLSVILLIASLMLAVTPEGVSMSQVWEEFFMGMKMMIELIQSEMNLNLASSLGILLVSYLVSPFLTITILFGALTMGQFFRKYRVMMSIICYIVILIVSNFFTSILQNLFMIYSPESYLNWSMISSTGFNLLIAAGLYSLSWFVVSKKLNME